MSLKYKMLLVFLSFVGVCTYMIYPKRIVHNTDAHHGLRDKHVPKLSVRIHDSILKKKVTCVKKTNVNYRSQSNEDKAMFEKFYKSPLKCGGVFVEIGALDGLKYSNSYFFEKALGWKSLLVEAHPQNAAALKKNRPDAWTVHAAMCTGDHVTFVGAGATGGVVDTMSPDHKKAFISKTYKNITVKCRQWGPLFKKYGIQHIDVFVIDVEGGEYTVLSVMDWTVSVDFFIIETSSSSSNENRQRIVTLLKSKGYKQVNWDLKSWCTPGNDCTSNTVFEKDLDKDFVRG